MTDKWYKLYHSDFLSGLAPLIMVLGGTVGALVFVNRCIDTIKYIDSNKPNPAIEYPLQEAELNGNNIPDKFYTIDGKMAIAELDGKPVSELYKK